MTAKIIVYRGFRDGTGCQVIWVNMEGPVDSGPISMRLDLRNHSPTGFGWGYGGSGPAQLALALCAHALGDDDVALRVYDAFKWKVVAGLPYGGWEILQANVLLHIEAIERAQAGEL